MNNKILMVAGILAGLVAVGAAGYFVGRSQAPQPAVPESQQQAATQTPGLPSAHPPAGDAATPPHGAGVENSVQFQVGGANVKALLVDGPITWLGTSSGLVRYQTDRDRHTRYDNRSGLLSNGVFYLGKFGDEIWVGTYGGGLSILDTKTERWRNYNIPNGMGDAFVYDVLVTRSGDVWIATWSGANRIVGGDLDSVEKWELYTVENTSGGLPNDWVYGLAEGKSGEIWLATEGGLARFQDGKWENWDHQDGLGADYEAVSADIEFQNDPGDYSAHHARQKKEQGLANIAVAYNPNYIISLVVDDIGVVWAGTWGAGLSRFDGKTWTTMTMKDGLPGNHVFALARDEHGALWIGTSSGLAKYDGKTVTTYGQLDGLYSESIFSIDVTDSGAWIGGYGGVTWFPQGIRKFGAIQ